MRALAMLVLAGCGGSAPRYTTADSTARPGLQIEVTEDESAQDLAPRPTPGGGEDRGTPDPEPAEAPRLDKDTIRRVVRSHTGQIRSCYEKQHRATPEIAGTIRVQFTIGPEGTVAEATATGIHRNVESCLATTFRQFTFPAPANGTHVQVTYPFAFQAG